MYVFRCFQKATLMNLVPGLSFFPFSAKCASEQVIWKSLTLTDKVCVPNNHSMF